MRFHLGRAAVCGVLLNLVPGVAAAAEGLDGAKLGIEWAIPFVGILLTIALGPLLAPKIFHHHHGKLAAFWAVLVVVALALAKGPTVTAEAVVHAALLEYIPFILLLFALFSTAGGLLVLGNFHGSPLVNASILLVGTGLASIIGTTGASMVMIRPLLRTNDNRRHKVHVVVFFIFLVSNIGGSLTPLGDPPLFLGYLKGVEFFWTTTHLDAATLFLTVTLIGIFLVLDWYFFRIDDKRPPLRDPTPDDPRVRLVGVANLPILVLIVGAILASGMWRTGISFHILGTELKLENIVRDVVLLCLGLLSLLVTPKEHRESNAFSWAPLTEVAKLFAGIFVCIIPVIAMLKAGPSGVFAPLIALVTGPDGQPANAAYFWLSGILSAFLDNAPTYLVFFELAGGDPVQLMGPLEHTLTAISMGAVFMGALTYIGNAPNFMVSAIARDQGVPMPSFFGYLAWSVPILVPLFAVVTWLFI